MTKIMLIAAAAIIAFPAAGLTQSQPSSDWNGNFQFRGEGGRANTLLQADLIERQESGYYGQWTQELYYTGTQNYFTTSNVGSVTNTTIEGDGNDLNTLNTNCGDVSGSINMDDGASDSDTHGGGCDQ